MRAMARIRNCFGIIRLQKARKTPRHKAAMVMPVHHRRKTFLINTLRRSISPDSPW
jgi:hypothetical protein